MFVELKLSIKFATANAQLAYGVIGNTPVFGTVIQGSSPCRPTKTTLNPFETAMFRRDFF